MAEGKTFRVIPDRRRGRAGESRRLADVIFLVIAAHEKCLTVSCIEIKFEQVSVVRGWCRRVETKAAGVDAVANCRVIRDIALSGKLGRVYRYEFWNCRVCGSDQTSNTLVPCSNYSNS